MGRPGASAPGVRGMTSPSEKAVVPGKAGPREAPLGTEVPPQELERRKQQIERQPVPGPRPQPDPAR